MTQMNCMVPGTHLDVLLCPQTCLKHNFWAISKFPENLVQAPGASPVASLFCPWHPYSARGVGGMAEGLFILYGTLSHMYHDVWSGAKLLRAGL